MPLSLTCHIAIEENSLELKHKTQKLKKDLIPTKNPPPKKNKEVKTPKNKIDPYSVIKIIENKPPPYSVLNPETNSDSPSEKSKGERFLSAKHAINHPINRGTQNK